MSPMKPTIVDNDPRLRPLTDSFFWKLFPYNYTPAMDLSSNAKYTLLWLNYLLMMMCSVGITHVDSHFIRAIYSVTILYTFVAHFTIRNGQRLQNELGTTAFLIILKTFLLALHLEHWSNDFNKVLMTDFVLIVNFLVLYNFTINE